MEQDRGPERWHILNGRLVGESELRISPRDVGLLRGYGIFDFLITYDGGRPFHLDDHIDRLFRSAALLEIDMAWPKQSVRQWTHDVLAANAGDGAEQQIRIVVTGGVGPDSLSPAKDGPTLVILADPRLPYPPTLYRDGVGIITAPYRRYCPQAKSLNYIEGVLRMGHAKRQGCVEVVYHDDRQVFEASTSNVFAVIEGKLCTPRSHILAGITRQVLLKILSLAEPVELRDFSLEELRAADEVFITASSKEVMSVTRIDGMAIGDGKVGQVTKEVMSQFRDYVQSGQW